jgi:hypothetical protein
LYALLLGQCLDVLSNETFEALPLKGDFQRALDGFGLLFLRGVIAPPVYSILSGSEKEKTDKQKER